MIKRLLRAFSKSTPDVPALIPDGVVVYAVGDIHGRLDLLRNLQRAIAEDAEAMDSATRKIVVYLGDYIDRGFESRGVIDCLLNEPMPGFEPVWLRGNHEESMLGFLADPVEGRGWLGYGGATCLLSYGVQPPIGSASPKALQKVGEAFARSIPPSHLDFIEETRLSFVIGDYLFVHAGIHPGQPLNEQTAESLLWIREPFLSFRGRHEKMVVHGHSVVESPDVKANRIGIDTGAYASNILTCLVLSGGERRFIHT